MHSLPQVLGKAVSLSNKGHFTRPLSKLLPDSLNRALQHSDEMTLLLTLLSSLRTIHGFEKGLAQLFYLSCSCPAAFASQMYIRY